MIEPQSQTGPNETPDSQSTHGKPDLLWTYWIALGLILVYPLSIGPVAKFYNGGAPPNSVVMFYAPLGVLYTRNAMFRRALDFYVGLWGARL